MSMFAAIVALCVVIIIHEAGHYLAAVWTGMKVDRFSVFGIGPTIVRLGTWRGTEFVISAIPFGAFVQIRGMEPSDEGDPVPGDAIDDDAWAKAMAAAKGEPVLRQPVMPRREASPNFRDKPLWARAAVLAGGPVANYLAAMLLLFGLFAIAGDRGPVTRIEVSQVNADEPAEAAGLQVGDRVVELDGVAIDPAAGTKPLIEVFRAHPGEPLAITLEREGQTVATIVEPSAEGRIGAGLDPTGDRIAMSVGEAAVRAVHDPIDLSKRQLVALYLLATGQLEAEVQGPVGIVKGIATSIERGFIPFVMTAAMISTLLGMFNLLPLPALDGGRLTFLGYEALTRRRAKPGVEEMVHGYGMLALLLLIAVVTVRDLGVIDKVRSFW